MKRSKHAAMLKFPTYDKGVVQERPVMPWDPKGGNEAGCFLRLDHDRTNLNSFGTTKRARIAYSPWVPLLSPRHGEQSSRGAK